MSFFRYFVESKLPFGGISYAMLFVWAIALGLGIYMLRSYRASNPVRARFMQQFATILSALSGLGLVLLVLKFFQVPVAEWRLWSYLVALAWLGYLGYTLYVYNTVLPARVAAVKPTRTGRPASNRGGAKTYAANGAAPAPRPPREPRPVATTTRRDARRDKKRKGR